MAKIKYSKSYLKYRELFYEQKRLGNIGANERVRSYQRYKQYAQNAAVKREKGNKSLAEYVVSSQSMFTKEQIRRLYSQYNKIKKTYTRGTSKEFETYNVNTKDYYSEKFSYHYTVSGLLKDKKFVHFIIQSRINDGEDREEVLADYGY